MSLTRPHSTTEKTYRKLFSNSLKRMMALTSEDKRSMVKYLTQNRPVSSKERCSACGQPISRPQT
jgi:hypothetical protein